MKQLLLGGALFVALAFTSRSSSETNVYYCANGKTEVYHLKKDCQGIKRCTHEVKTVSKDYAVGTLKLRLCGYED